ncbi:MAG: ZIP family metal transporter [Candidatus Paceibacterota bacterium]|jgi:ZIP family zinc transporter
MIIWIALATFCSTLLGGLFALRFRDKLHLILGFSAGAVIGVAFFDLLPEAINLGQGLYDVSFVTGIVALGFIVYMTLDRLILFHPPADEDCLDCHNEHHQLGSWPQGLWRGKLGAGTLAVHSFLDGLAIGLAFQVSSAVGVIVAVAVLTHDFSDGINTVGLILKTGHSAVPGQTDPDKKRQAFSWLLIDAIAPVLGVLATLFFTLSETSLGLILAVFCGFFLYIGASELLPESHHGHSTRLTTLMTILGALVLYLAVKLAGV